MWSSPPPPTSSWLGSREALSQERTIQPADHAGRREGHRTLLPAAFHCLIGSDCSSQPQVLFLRINISTGLMTRWAPGQLALACIWSRFLCCHIPIVLDCSLPQIRGWLHCPNPTTTPRCLFVGRMNTSCSMKCKKKEPEAHVGSPQSPLCSVVDRMSPSQPLPGLRPAWACLSKVDSEGRRCFQEAGLSPSLLPTEGTPRGFSCTLSPSGTSRS